MIYIRADFGLYLGIAIYELLMGIAYNLFTAWLERKGYMEGFVSLVVAFGVALTVIPWILFNLPSYTVIGGFICSGLPMIIGSISRHLQQRARAREELKRLSTYGDNSTRMAK